MPRFSCMSSIIFLLFSADRVGSSPQRIECHLVTAPRLIVSRGLEPQANTSDEARRGRIFAICAGVLRSLTGLRFIGHADVRREFPGDLVAEPQTELGLAAACSDPTFRHVLPRKIGFDPRMQAEDFRQPSIVMTFRQAEI